MIQDTGNITNIGDCDWDEIGTCNNTVISFNNLSFKSLYLG